MPVADARETGANAVERTVPREYLPRVSARTARKHTGVRAEAARTTRVSGVSAKDRAAGIAECFPARDGPCDDYNRSDELEE